MSRKAELADEPHIENLLEKYSSSSDLTILALGSSYWTPPEEAMHHMIQHIQSDVSSPFILTVCFTSMVAVHSSIWQYSRIHSFTPFHSTIFPPVTSFWHFCLWYHHHSRSQWSFCWNFIRSVWIAAACDYFITLLFLSFGLSTTTWNESHYGSFPANNFITTMGGIRTYD